MGRVVLRSKFSLDLGKSSGSRWNREIHEEGSALGWAKLVIFVILEHKNAYQKPENTPNIAGRLSCPRH